MRRASLRWMFACGTGSPLDDTTQV